MTGAVRQARRSVRAAPAFAVVLTLTLAAAGFNGLMVALMALRLDALLPGPLAQMGHFTQPHHRIHDLTFALLLLPAMLGLVAQVRHPARNVAGMLMTLIPPAALFVVLLFTLPAGDTRVLQPPWLIVGAGALFATALHPAGSDFFSSFRWSRLNRAMVALVAVAVAGLFPLAVSNIGLQAAVSDDHAAAGHYGFMAAFAVTTIGLGLLASLRPDGWRLPAWTAGLLPALLGGTSIIYPQATSSLATPWAFAAIAWGALFLAVTQLSRGLQLELEAVQSARQKRGGPWNSGGRLRSSDSAWVDRQTATQFPGADGPGTSGEGVPPRGSGRDGGGPERSAAVPVDVFQRFVVPKGACAAVRWSSFGRNAVQEEHVSEVTPDDARRLRGRLAGGVTVWTAGEGPSACGLTVGSVIVTEGEPPHVLGTVGDLADFLDAMRATGRFVVHVLANADCDLDAPLTYFRGQYRRLADPPHSWEPGQPTRPCRPRERPSSPPTTGAVGGERMVHEGWRRCARQPVRSKVPRVPTHPNAELLAGFYGAFDRRDGDAMAACYAPDARFSDPVFTNLRGAEPGAMWRMLTSRSDDLRVELVDHSADDTAGSAHCVARYTFAPTSRPVVNDIRSTFRFAGGLIVEHRDVFDFHRWARQALGLPGLLFGWTPVLRSSVQRKARASLDAWMTTAG